MTNEDLKKKWTREELETHIQVNSDYSSAIVMAALYHKIFGEFPKIGLSGAQAGGAEFLLSVFPENKARGEKW